MIILVFTLVYFKLEKIMSVNDFIVHFNSKIYNVHHPVLKNIAHKNMN